MPSTGTLNIQGRSLCHLQYTQHAGEESIPSTVHSTHKGGVYPIYSTLNTLRMSLCHLQYTEHTGEESLTSTVHSTAQGRSLCRSVPSTVHLSHRGGVYTIYSTINTQGRSLCHLQYTQHTGEESMSSTVPSTRRG
jgi:hypothetical protein